MNLDTHLSRTISELFAAFAQAMPIAHIAFYTVKSAITYDVALKIVITLT